VRVYRFPYVPVRVLADTVRNTIQKIKLHASRAGNIEKKEKATAHSGGGFQEVFLLLHLTLFLKF
jgi:hypothetical protein